MSTRWVRLGFVGAGVSLLAACAGEQVWLGQARLGLDDCEGAACVDAGPAQQPPQPPSVQPPLPPQPVPGEPDLVDVSVKGRCDVPVSAELSVEQRITDTCGATEPGSCFFQAPTLSPTADGGAWIVGGPTVPLTSSPLSTRYWLLRYGADGAVRCKVEVPSHQNALAVADNGHVWFARLRAHAESSYVQRYDDTCQPVGGPLAGLSDVAGIANVPGTGVAIVHGREDNVMTLRDQDGQELWSRPGTGDFRASVSAAGGSPLLLGTSRRRGSAGGITVHAFDALGNTRWQTSTRGNAAYLYFPNYFASGYDQQGNLMLAFTPSDPLGQTAGLDYYADVESIDPSGQTRWVLRVSVSGAVGAAVAPSGAVYVGGLGPIRASTPMPMAEIAADGGSCRRLAYDGPTTDKLIFSPSGRLWYASIEGEFGRFGPLP